MTNSFSTLYYCSDANFSDVNVRRNKVALFAYIYMLMLLGGHQAVLIPSMMILVDQTESHSLSATIREVYHRTTWKLESARFTDRMFLRLFRMHRPCFNKLCAKILAAVGPSNFKDDCYLETLESLGTSTRESSMFHASKHTSGTYISGEFKLAVTLRVLAGASYLDMYLWANISPEHVIRIVKRVCKEWLCDDRVMKIDFYSQVLQSRSSVNQIKHDFGTSSGGVLAGCIGAIDGWLVKIRCPTLQESNNPGKYMSRKGFFSLNCQAICDKQKRILWRCIGERGSSHDSSVFKSTQLYEHLMLISEQLQEEGLYLVGDSAYSLRTFLMCPYDNTSPCTEEDSFNFYLSSARIYIECCFGEIDRRFGIFWRPLEGALSSHQFTIDACLRLHNEIVNFRLEQEANLVEMMPIEEEMEELDIQSYEYLTANAGETLGVFGDEGQPRGRPTLDEAENRDKGVQLRNDLRDEIKRKGMARRGNNRMNGTSDRYNRMNTTSEN